VADLPAAIAALEVRLHDPALYAKDRKGFERLTGELDRTRARLALAETDWLELEARREALVSGG
jgi:ABC transport system ATP-binding/permease protein